MSDNTLNDSNTPYHQCYHLYQVILQYNYKWWGQTLDKHYLDHTWPWSLTLTTRMEIEKLIVSATLLLTKITNGSKQHRIPSSNYESTDRTSKIWTFTRTDAQYTNTEQNKWRLISRLNMLNQAGLITILFVYVDCCSIIDLSHILFFIESSPNNVLLEPSVVCEAGLYNM